MKRALLYAVLSMLSVGNHLCGQAAPALPVTLTISAPATIQASSKLYLKIVMKNISDQPVDDSTFAVGCADLRFRIDIRDQDGRSMKKEDLHPEHMPGSVAMSTLAPGESAERSDCVTWHNDLSQPGTYTIQVSRVIGHDEKNGLAKSNIIAVTVLPKSESAPK
jgi:hypothetical protein